MDTTGTLAALIRHREEEELCVCARMYCTVCAGLFDRKERRAVAAEAASKVRVID